MSAPYTEDQLTDWFPPHVKPARPGVYEVNFNTGLCWCYWTGAQWSNAAGTPEMAVRNCNWIDGAVQDKLWRGLSFDSSHRGAAALQQFAESIEFSGPDGDGLFWMHAGVPGGLKVGVNLGPERGIVARAAAQLEQLRGRALLECKR